ncbi:MAG TPA: hypothetical protein VIO16_06840 [Dehalococcoidia bacterium]
MKSRFLVAVAAAAALALAPLAAEAAPRKVAVDHDAGPLVKDVFNGAVVGAIVGGVLCGPAFAACGFGTYALTTWGAVGTGAAIGAVSLPIVKGVTGQYRDPGANYW